MVWRRYRYPTPTPLFDTLWHFAAERQRIFRARLSGSGWKTSDPVLQNYRFTNAYRASDRTSQYLIREVIYDKERDFREEFARTVLFKIFNRIDTWEHLTRSLGEISREKVLEEGPLEEALEELRSKKKSMYSAVYVMPSATQYGSNLKHINHLRMLRQMIQENLDIEIAGASTMEEAYKALLRYPTTGEFLAFQFLTDLNYGPHLNFREDEFIRPGPGSILGIRRCFVDTGDCSRPDTIRWIMENQEKEFERRGIDFEDLWGRRLQLVDCQSLFCEIYKYERLNLKDEKYQLGHQYNPKPTEPTAWYPPKWGINEAVEKWREKSKPKPPVYLISNRPV